MTDKDKAIKTTRDEADDSRRAFVKKAVMVAAAVPAVALLASLNATPLSAKMGYGMPYTNGMPWQ